MKTLPPLLIVTDRGHFIAYRIYPDGNPEVLDHATFAEGVQKLSEQVTDRAGGFPNGGTEGKGNSAAERMTLVAEMEMRCFRHIGEHITNVLKSHEGPWGFAAPSEINSAILDQLDKTYLTRLKINVPRDLARIPSVEIPQHFMNARQSDG